MSPDRHLGTPGNLTRADADTGRTLGRLARSARAEKLKADLKPVLQDIIAAGYTSLNQIAAALNERRIPAARGGYWSAVQVARVRTGAN